MSYYRPGKIEKLFFKMIPNPLLFRFYKHFKYFKFIQETENTQTPIRIETWYTQKIKSVNHAPFWPVHPTSTVLGWKNIEIGIETSPGISPGNFMSAYYGRISIGDYTQIAPNVGIIAENHDIYDNSAFNASEVIIGKYCWIGMGAVILPGVQLGDFTIVGAGSIVTKSFSDGYCVIGGNPAKKIKDLDPSLCIRKQSNFEYYGYLPKDQVESFLKNQK